MWRWEAVCGFTIVHSLIASIGPETATNTPELVGLIDRVQQVLKDVIAVGDTLGGRAHYQLALWEELRPPPMENNLRAAIAVLETLFHFDDVSSLVWKLGDGC